MSHEREPAQPPPGLLLVGHGTRDPRGQQGFQQTALLIARLLPDRIVRHAYLELAEPTIPAGLQALAAAGARRITVAPLLLLAAGHIRRDIPAAVAAAAGEMGMIVERQTPHLGSHPAILELSHLRYAEAVERAPTPPIPSAQTLLLVVARGATDPSALAEMREIFALRARRTGLSAELCFLAMAEPTLEETIAQVAASNYRKVIVQPHLLFAGALADRLADTVQQVAGRNPGQRWVMTETLGAHPLLAEAVIDQLHRAERAGPALDEPTPFQSRS